MSRCCPLGTETANQTRENSEVLSCPCPAWLSEGILPFPPPLFLFWKRQAELPWMTLGLFTQQIFA